MGDLGYISEIQDNLNISINSIEEYIQDLKNALTKPHVEYKNIGESLDGERIQLNSSVIQIENEYYSTIRPKRTCPSGERPINILRSQGIEYLELRCVDLDPFSPIGIDRNQIDFLDIFLFKKTYHYFFYIYILDLKKNNFFIQNRKPLIHLMA